MSKSKSEIEITELSKKHAPHFVKKRRCRIEGCERPVNPACARNSHYVCGYHHMQIQYRRRPVVCALYTLRHNARQRKRKVSISRRHWFYLNYFTLYWKYKGVKPHSLTIDRIDNNVDYCDENVQVVDKRYNIQKKNGKDLWAD